MKPIVHNPRVITAMVLEDNRKRLAISVLDYEESDAANRSDRNALLTSLEIEHDGKSSIVTAPVISTHELSALANWFEQLAAGRRPEPVVLQEPCLFFDCPEREGDSFRVAVRMEAEASPTWTKYYAEPFEMDFRLTHQQMIETARSLRRLHLNYPTRS